VITFVGALAGTGPVLARVLPAALGAGLLAYGGTRGRKIGVDVEETSVLLRGFVHDRRVPLSEVDRFVLEDRWPYGTVLALRDGSQLRTVGLGVSGIRHHQVRVDRARSIVEALNEDTGRQKGNG
jgi:hypothetical protein